jgi:hypothetical protein
LSTAPQHSTPPAKPSSKLAALLPIFFQLLLHRYQDVVNQSKVLPASPSGVANNLWMTGPPIVLPFQRLDAEKLALAMADFMKMEASSGGSAVLGHLLFTW